MANSWSMGTHKQYSPFLRFIRGMEYHHGFTILGSPQVLRPPQHPSIPLGWCQERYLLRAGRPRNGESGPVAYNTARSLRSAANLHYSWVHSLISPDTAAWDITRHVQFHNAIVPTAALSVSLLNSGMRTRRGDNPTPSKALLASHIHGMDEHFRHMYNTSTNIRAQRFWARAGVLNSIAWGSWLRGGELLSLTWDRVIITEPGNGPSVGLPPGVGAIQLFLRHTTKTSRHKRADVVVAYTYCSRLSPGKWLHRLRVTLPGGILPDTPTPLFCNDDNTPWTSAYFRSTFLLPCLELLRQRGDPYLQALKGDLATYFYSLHSYRSGANTHVQQKREGCKRAATEREKHEQARWRYKPNSQTIQQRYDQAPLFDRVLLTLLCM